MRLFPIPQRLLHAGKFLLLIADLRLLLRKRLFKACKELLQLARLLVRQLPFLDFPDKVFYLVSFLLEEVIQAFIPLRAEEQLFLAELEGV